MKLMLLVEGLVLCIAFTGCTSTVTAATHFQTHVTKARAVVQPTLLSVKATTVSDPAQQLILGELVKGDAALCAVSARSIPAAVQVVGLPPIDNACANRLDGPSRRHCLRRSPFGTPTAAPVSTSGAIPS
ncbi:hypothetical protein [Paraburkholderia xenovorans]